MNNTLVCLEGTINFNEDVKIQTINILTFRTGQQITASRDVIPTDQTLAEHISQQITNAERIFNQFNLVKMDEVNDGTFFADTIQVIYSFLSGQGSNKRVWQVTYACRISDNETLNFTSMYPDEASMKNESGRLQHCAKSFILNKN